MGSHGKEGRECLNTIMCSKAFNIDLLVHDTTPHLYDHIMFAYCCVHSFCAMTNVDGDFRVKANITSGLVNIIRVQRDSWAMLEWGLLIFNIILI